MASRSNDSQTYVSASDVPGNIELILRRSPADRELFRYFERFTSGALALSSDIWGTEVLTSALKVTHAPCHPFNLSDRAKQAI
jgi:hypothetical protein